MTIIAAADGSALGNPGPAGWAWYIDESTWACGGWKRGTNNQGELTAVLDLLRQTAHQNEALHVLCDSKYVINSITSWMPGWKRKGWKKADGKPVLNVEIMKALDAAMAGREVTFEWVKGHAGHELNERADKLANGAAQAFSRRAAFDGGPGFPGAQAAGAGEDPTSPPAALSGSGGGSAERDSASGGRRGSAPEDDAEPAELDLFSFSEPEPTSPAEAAPDSISAEDSDSPLAVTLEALERKLLTDDARADLDTLLQLVDERWLEITASGRTFTPEILLSRSRSHSKANVEILEVRELGSEAALVRWRVSGPDREPTLRCSVWQRIAGTWKQVYQQGTRES